MALTIGRARLSVHPLFILFPLTMALLGGRADAAALMIGLIAHEGAHLLAARLAGVGVSRLRLMPFGGAIDIGNPYALSARRLALVAAAGPLASAALTLVAAALLQWRAVAPEYGIALTRANATLLLFNLLPALPLDGGRVLYALLIRRVSRARAAEIGIWLGRAVAAALLAACIAGGVARGRFNLSPAMAAAFILASTKDERESLAGANARALLSALRPVLSPVPVRLFAVGGACGAREALRAAGNGASTLYAVYEGDRLSALADDRQLLAAALERGGDIPVREAVTPSFSRPACPTPSR